MKPINVKILFAFFLTSLFFCSCLEQQDAQPVVVQENPTPQVLSNAKDKPSTDFAVISKRIPGSYRDNILPELFTEAREKDGKLDSLITSMDKINQKWGDSISNIQEYMRNNTAYYSNAQNLIQSLYDSTLQKSTATLFKEFEKKYKTKIKEHEALLSQIEKLKKEIHDNKILTKLYVTAGMIENYQNNELPKTKALQDLISNYTDLINQSKAYQK